MLRDLGYMNIETFHLNEGHAGFLTLELMREQGYYDPDKIREQVVFTTHTPVPAGHDYFEFGLIERAFPTDALSTIKRMMPDVPGVSMTELGLKYSRYVNGVAKKHAEVSNAMFRMETVDWVTNGVHPTTWVSSGMRKLYNRHIPGWEEDPGRLVQALTIPKQDLWSAHQASKLRLFARVLETTGRQLDPEVLTLGFARRAATYKRADLLLSDLERFMEVAGNRKVQFIFAGKSHPSDNGGKALLQKIRKAARDLEESIPIVFIDNYNMEIASLITQGVDLWLNTPMRPHEFLRARRVVDRGLDRGRDGLVHRPRAERGGPLRPLRRVARRHRPLREAREEDHPHLLREPRQMAGHDAPHDSPERQLLQHASGSPRVRLQGLLHRFQRDVRP